MKKPLPAVLKNITLLVANLKGVSERMLTMEQQKYIKKCCINKGESINSVAKKTGHHWSTIKKYVEKEDFNQPIKIRQKRTTKLDKVKPIIDQWLLEDKKAKPKQRHTAKRIYDRLCEEYADIFSASDRTVREYVSKRKKELYDDTEGYVPLNHPGGEAQVDFGEVEFFEKGTKISGFHLNISFPNSNAGYVQLFKGQNLECLLTGLQSIFKHMGKVPNKIWFDNLSPVVSKIEKQGKRKLTEGFERFALHYGFEHNFCNPNSGHEKGSVESKVGYYRRNFLVPIPRFDSIDEFNKKLFVKADEDMKRAHYKKDAYISKLFELERIMMRDLPKKDYEVYRLEKAKADAYGKVKLDKDYSYSISPAFSGKEVWLKITHSKVHILNEDYKTILSHNRLNGKNYESMDWVPYLVLMQKRPTALKYTSFYDDMPLDLKSYFEKCDREEKKVGLKVLSKLLLEMDLEKASEVFKLAEEKNLRDEDSLTAAYHRLTRGVLEIKDIKLSMNVPNLDPYITNNSEYDIFLKGGVQ